MCDLDVIDLTNNFPFVLDITPEISMEDIQVGKTYIAKFRVYTAQPSKEIEKRMAEILQGKDEVKEILEDVKRSTGHYSLYRFELVELSLFR